MADPKHSLYRAIHHMRHGGLHKALGVPLDENIPAAKTEAATHSSNAHVKHMADFAQTLEGLHKK